MAVDPFTAFLAAWAAGKMLDNGLDVFSSALGEKYLQSLRSSPESHDWNHELTPDQLSLIKTLRNTTPSRLRSFIARFKTVQERSIVLLGPSGVGKTCVAIRLAGDVPERVKATFDNSEKKRFVGKLRAIHVYAPPGYKDHGDYLHTVTNLMKSDKPPSVIVMVTCGGFHATADPLFEGRIDKPNFDRPGWKGKKISALKDFREACLQEEEDYLEDLHGLIKGRMTESIPWVITVVNKKDLWWSSKKTTLHRYESENSPYGRALLKIRGSNGIGAPDGSIAQHVVFPAYLTDDGFGPSPSISSTSFRQAHMEADAMVLRALVFNKYTRGI